MKSEKNTKNKGKIKNFRFFLKIICFCLVVSNKSPTFAPSKDKNSINALSEAQNKNKMEKQNLFAALVAIATANAEGLTVDAQTLQPVSKGYAVAVAETQNSFGREGLARVIDFVQNNKTARAFGGWLDSETGLYYWDAVQIYKTKKAAARAAKRNKQIAFFDLARLVEIRVK